MKLFVLYLVLAVLFLGSGICYGVTAVIEELRYGVAGSWGFLVMSMFSLFMAQFVLKGVGFDK